MKCTMKTVALSLFLTLLTVFLFLALPVNGEEAVYDSVVRLHVLPASDSAEDQNLKIAVRDAVLCAYGTPLAALKSSEEAQAYLQAELPNIQKSVNDFLREHGSDCHATVTLAKEYFETRQYGEITLPAGEYTSLSVRLGKGEGQNWWCVLYPALCTQAAMGESVSASAAGLSEAEYRLVSDSGYLLKFRVLEILKAIFD